MSNENDSKLPDLSYIRELAGIFQDHELDELEIETGETRMLLRRGDMPVVTQAAAPVSFSLCCPAAHRAHCTAPRSTKLPFPSDVCAPEEHSRQSPAPFATD